MATFNRMMGKRTCLECGGQFEAPTYAGISFCSSSCEKLAKKAKISKTCAVCKNTFLTNRKEIVYCSKACAGVGKILVRRKYRREYIKRPGIREKANNYLRDYRKRRR